MPSRFIYTQDAPSQHAVQPTYQGHIFRHFEVDELARSLGLGPAQSASQAAWNADLFVLERLGEAVERCFFLFAVAHPVDELQKVLKTIFLELCRNHAAW